MKIIFAIFFSALYFIVSSQQADIKVIDKETHKIIPFVNISFESLSSGEKYNLTTDINGEITNSCKDKSLIIISIIAYKTLIDTVLPGQSKVYELERDYFELEQITVTTGTRTEKALKEVPVLTHVITSEELQTYGAIDIQDALTNILPSVAFSKSHSGKSLKIQGLDAEYIVFLIDGEKVAGETNGNVDYERFNSYNIERIEIIKGAASTLYGSNAISGVVNIITKKTKKKIEASVGSRYSILNSTDKNYGEFDFNASIGANIKKISSRTDFHLKNNEGFIYTYKNENDTNIIKLDPYNTFNISQKLEYKPTDKFSVEVKANYYERDRENSVINPIEYKIDKQYSYRAKAYYKMNKDNNISASWFSDMYKTFYVDKFYDDKETLVYSNRYDNARITGNFKLLKKQLLSFGAEFINDKLFSDRIEEKKKQVNNYVIFLQDDINFTERFNSIIGLRINWHSVYNFHIVPQISFMYKLHSFNFRANYGMGFKAPTMKELYMNYSPVPIVEVHGNPDLKPETSHYYSASVEFAKNKINTSVSFYQNRVTNMINEVQDINNQVIWKYVNINDLVITGIDFLLRVKIKYGFSFTGAYSFTDSEDKAQGQQMPGVAKNSGLISLGYKLRKQKYKLTVNLQTKYIDKISYNETDAVTGEETIKFFNRHFIWKLTSTQTFFKGIVLTFGIDNILNYKDIQNIITINPGRSWFTGLNIYFQRLNFKQ